MSTEQITSAFNTFISLTKKYKPRIAPWDSEHVFKLCNNTYYLDNRMQITSADSLNKIRLAMLSKRDLKVLIKLYQTLLDHSKFELLTFLRYYGIYDVSIQLLSSDHIDYVPTLSLESQLARDIYIHYVAHDIKRYQLYRIEKTLSKTRELLLSIYMNMLADVPYESSFTSLEGVHALLCVSNIAHFAHKKASFNNFTAGLFLGLYFVTHPYQILRYLNTATATNVQQNLVFISKQLNLNFTNSYKLLSQKLKQLSNVEMIQNCGKKYIKSALSYLKKCNSSDPQYFKNEHRMKVDTTENTNAQPYIDYIEYVFTKILKNPDKTKEYYIDIVLIIYRKFNVSNYNSLFWNVMVLRALSRYYYWKKKYWIGLKMLRDAFKLANGYILQKSFIEMDYKKQKQKFLKKLERLECGNTECDVRYTQKRLKPCSGCMNVSYCSSNCHKIHWNTEHSRKCDKSWEMTNCARISDIDRCLKRNMEYISIHFEGPKWNTIYMANPTEDINNLTNGEQIVTQRRIVLCVYYPLRKKYLFEITRKKPISLKQLAIIICNLYKHIYDEEDATCAVKHEPSSDCKGYLVNRHATNGKYGIFGNNLGDLGLYGICDHGNHMYSPVINSQRPKV